VTPPSGWGGGRAIVSESPALNAVTSNLFQCDFTKIYVSASGVEWMSGGTKRQCDRALRPLLPVMISARAAPARGGPRRAGRAWPWAVNSLRTKLNLNVIKKAITVGTFAHI
jgi:hypothetical protein